MNIPGDSNAARLSQMLNYNLTQMIFVAVKLGIPDLLAERPWSIDELAGAVGAHPPSLHRLMRALASLGIFAENQQNRFEQTPLAELLRSGLPGSFHAFALSYGEPWWWNSWGSLLYSVQTGETAFEHVYGQGLFDYLDGHAEAADIFHANMRAMTDEEAQGVATAYDFSDTHLLIDIGSGQGALVKAILMNRPSMRAILFDLPQVMESTWSLIQFAGLADRCVLEGGSFFESIPAGGDTYTLKDVIHDWDDKHALAILRNCHQAMAPYARLLLIERILPPGNAPAIGKLIDISMLVFTGGKERTGSEYSALLERAGFRLNRIVPSLAEVSIIEAVPV